MRTSFALVLCVATIQTTNLFGAAVTTFSSRPTFLSAVSGANTWDFNGPNGNPVIILNSLGTNIVGVSTQGGDAAGVINDNALCGSSGGSVNCFPPVVFTLLQPRQAFGFDNLDLIPGEEAVANVAFSNGDPTQQFVFDLGGQPSFTPIFFGITSDQAIASVSVYSRDVGTRTIGERANVVDNVTVANPIPEPATAFLLFTASVGLCSWRGRIA